MSIETAVFGGGCFWCTESVFSSLKGVLKVVPGYSGGSTIAPNYQQVCSGTTGHAEVVEIKFDPAVISFRALLDVFFHTHDPTTPNRQGNDMGQQYRSIILYTSDTQKFQSLSYIRELEAGGEFGLPIVTQVKPLTEFYPAEAYHHRYYEKNSGQPYCRMVIAPKLAKFRDKFKESITSA